MYNEVVENRRKNTADTYRFMVWIKMNSHFGISSNLAENIWALKGQLVIIYVQFICSCGIFIVAWFLLLTIWIDRTASLIVHAQGNQETKAMAKRTATPHRISLLITFHIYAPDHAHFILFHSFSIGLYFGLLLVVSSIRTLSPFGILVKWIVALFFHSQFLLSSIYLGHVNTQRANILWAPTGYIVIVVDGTAVVAVADS